MKYTFITLLILIASTSASAKGFKTENETKIFSNKLVTQFVNNDFDNALNSAKPYWPIPAVEIDGMVNQIKQQWPLVKQRFGKATGKELVQTKRIGKSFIRYIYLHKFENHSIYWQIDFYKPKNEWKINTLVFLDTLNALYE